MSDRTYYEVIAQIVPILFLTMAVGEARVRIRDTLSLPSAVLGVLFIGVVLVAAEVAALRVLMDGHGSSFARHLTAVGVGVGFAWVVRALARRDWRNPGARPGERRTKRGKNAGRPNSSAIRPTEDAAPRSVRRRRTRAGVSPIPPSAVLRDRIEDEDEWPGGITTLIDATFVITASSVFFVLTR